MRHMNQRHDAEIDVSSVQVEIGKHVHGWCSDLGQQCRHWTENRLHRCVAVSLRGSHRVLGGQVH